MSASKKTSDNLLQNLGVLAVIQRQIDEQRRKILGALSGDVPVVTADPDPCPDKSDPTQDPTVYACQLAKRILYDLGFYDSQPDPCQAYCDAHDTCGGTT